MAEAFRVGFAGTPPFAATALEAILDAGFEVSLTLTRPDAAKGRGMKLTPSAV
jgi:methionyl-tRNA formyltransferase